MFALRLKELREKAGYSQAQLAKKLGVRQSTVGMWESGKSKPLNAKMEMLTQIFGVGYDYLMGRTDGEDANPEDHTESPDLQMTEAEYALSMRWRKLSDKGKRDVMNFIQYTETMEQDGNEEE